MRKKYPGPLEFVLQRPYVTPLLATFGEPQYRHIDTYQHHPYGDPQQDTGNKVPSSHLMARA